MSKNCVTEIKKPVKTELYADLTALKFIQGPKCNLAQRLCDIILQSWASQALFEALDQLDCQGC